MLRIILIPLLFAQSAEFEVASIRLRQGHEFRPSELMVSSSLVRLRGYTIFGLVMDAFNIKDYQLRFENVAKAEDVYDDQYDISARTPGDGVPEITDVRRRLLNLLTERFQMRFHREMKETPVDRLEVGKGGLRLTKSAGAGPCVAKTRLAPDGRNDLLTFTACTLDEVAESLGHLEDRPVVDGTGVAGRFDFQLVAIPEGGARRGGDAADISPITAVRDLGLRLVPQKASVEIVVIDHVEKPSGN